MSALLAAPVVSQMTAGDRLNEYLARRKSSRDIREPLVRALYWKRYRWAAEERLEDIGTDPDRERAWVNADYERAEAAREHRKIIQDEWDARFLSRTA